MSDQELAKALLIVAKEHGVEKRVTDGVRLLQLERGATVEEIAGAQGVSPRAVQKSLERVEKNVVRVAF